MLGKEHGLRVVFNQLGDIGVRLFRKGKRIAQISMSPEGAVMTSPAPIDGGGLKQLKSHLHLVAELEPLQKVTNSLN